MKGTLLWSERPVLLEREVETHRWMEENRPWEVFGLELVHSNRPGGWVQMVRTFEQTWNQARLTGLPLINVESDVVPTLEAFRSVLSCGEAVCVYPYENVMLGAEPRTGAVVERRVQGGWESRFAIPGDRWAMDADLGFVKFSPQALAKPFPTDINKEIGDVLINTAIFRNFRDKDLRNSRGNLHLHWPALKNNHVFWDEGDFAHHAPERWDELARSHAKYLPPPKEQIL
jgi:hypothetical protein